MGQMIKRTSEITGVIPKVLILDDRVHIYCELANHYVEIGSFYTDDPYELYYFEWSKNGGDDWYTGKLHATQPEPDLENIPFKNVKRNVIIAWDSIYDVHCLYGYTDMMIRLKFSDAPDLGGTLSAWFEYTISELYQAPNGNVIPVRPYSGDNDLSFKFKTIVSVKDCVCHFKIEVDTSPTFDSGNQVVKDSSTSQTGWTYDGGAFPSQGCPSAQTESAAKWVEFTHADLDALSNEVLYYWRITPTIIDNIGTLGSATWDHTLQKFIKN